MRVSVDGDSHTRYFKAVSRFFSLNSALSFYQLFIFEKFIAPLDDTCKLSGLARVIIGP